MTEQQQDDTPDSTGTESGQHRDLHDMGGAIGAASQAGEGNRRDLDEIDRSAGDQLDPEGVASLASGDETGIDPAPGGGLGEGGADGETAARIAAKGDVQ